MIIRPKRKQSTVNKRDCSESQLPVLKALRSYYQNDTRNAAYFCQGHRCRKIVNTLNRRRGPPKYGVDPHAPNHNLLP